MVGMLFIIAGGGPDGYGYYWFDNGDGVPFEWYDLQNPPSWAYVPIMDSADGTLANAMWIPTSAQTRITGGDEQYNNSQTLPFNITYFGNTIPAGSNFTISTNGWLAFASYTSPYLSNTSFPNPALPNNIIAPFWDDLASRVWVGVINDIRTYWPLWPDSTAALVITWDSAGYWSSSDSKVAEFQVVILDTTDPNGNNIIAFIYKSPLVGTATRSASIGFENSTGTIGNAYTGVLSVGTTPSATNFNPGVVVFNSAYIPGDSDVVFLGSGDEYLFTYNLPFDVKFYGTTYAAGSPVKISTNGFISFDASITSPYLSNSSIPSTLSPNALLAIWWDDNVVDGAIKTKVIGTAPNRKWVVRWERVRRYGGSGGTADFEVIVYEDTTSTGDNKIVFSYNDTNFGSSTPSATIGIENQTGSIGLPYTGSRITGTQPNISAILDSTSILYQTEIFTSVSERANMFSVFITKEGVKVIGKANVDVYNAIGKKVLSSTVENSTLKLEDLPRGIYFIRVGDKTYKFIR
ncbi:MAG: T9SS type A sorting domain-containing protein [candidate division WOR-3 bacterium]